ncbi:hypothetical protein OH76DRAFT_1556768 [Lentinus brumalis]|uniref:Uncharacterized protein n=1 Tax=Lentinus brumalis TaxID=2498619 RepID=A0A371D883_9APHY|nr:hypothetical protein OH76DRAFT_1556768 [Polyporus brumalis]
MMAALHLHVHCLAYELRRPPSHPRRMRAYAMLYSSTRCQVKRTSVYKLRGKPLTVQPRMAIVSQALRDLQSYGSETSDGDALRASLLSSFPTTPELNHDGNIDVNAEHLSPPDDIFVEVEEGEVLECCGDSATTLYGEPVGDATLPSPALTQMALEEEDVEAQLASTERSLSLLPGGGEPPRKLAIALVAPAPSGGEHAEGDRPYFSTSHITTIHSSVVLEVLSLSEMAKAVGDSTTLWLWFECPFHTGVERRGAALAEAIHRVLEEIRHIVKVIRAARHDSVPLRSLHLRLPLPGAPIGSLVQRSREVLRDCFPRLERLFLNEVQCDRCGGVPDMVSDDDDKTLVHSSMLQQLFISKKSMFSSRKTFLDSTPEADRREWNGTATLACAGRHIRGCDHAGCTEIGYLDRASEGEHIATLLRATFGSHVDYLVVLDERCHRLEFIAPADVSCAPTATESPEDAHVPSFQDIYNSVKKTLAASGFDVDPSEIPWAALSERLVEEPAMPHEQGEEHSSVRMENVQQDNLTGARSTSVKSEDHEDKEMALGDVDDEEAAPISDASKSPLQEHSTQLGAADKAAKEEPGNRQRIWDRAMDSLRVQDPRDREQAATPAREPCSGATSGRGAHHRKSARDQLDRKYGRHHRPVQRGFGGPQGGAPLPRVRLPGNAGPLLERVYFYLTDNRRMCNPFPEKPVHLAWIWGGRIYDVQPRDVRIPPCRARQRSRQRISIQFDRNLKARFKGPIISYCSLSATMMEVLETITKEVQNRASEADLSDWDRERLVIEKLQWLKDRKKEPPTIVARISQLLDGEGEDVL